MTFQNVLYYREPKSGSSLFFGSAFFYPIESFKNPLQIFRGNTKPIIFHIDLDLAFTCLYTHDDFSSIVIVFNRIENQVLADSVDFLAIGYCHIAFRGLNIQFDTHFALGRLVHRDPLAQRMRTMRLHGMSRDAFDRFTSKTPAWYYEVVAPGFKYNMTDVAAAMGVEQLARLPQFVQRRQTLASRYNTQLAPLPLLLPADAPHGDTHAWHLYVIRLRADAPLGRDEVIQALSDRGIGTSVHYVPLHRHPYWRDRYQLTPEMFPQADAAYQAMISIPLFTAMGDSDQDRVIAALHEVLG